uniref:Uncharacterized protein n=1 Tax=Anguilla anguilla TaxID=7936 RepID=A0A0E9RYQ1_ANGAN
MKWCTMATHIQSDWISHHISTVSIIHLHHSLVS